MVLPAGRKREVCVGAVAGAEGRQAALCAVGLARAAGVGDQAVRLWRAAPLCSQPALRQRTEKVPGKQSLLPAATAALAHGMRGTGLRGRDLQQKKRGQPPNCTTSSALFPLLQPT